MNQKNNDFNYVYGIIIGTVMDYFYRSILNSVYIVLGTVPNQQFIDSISNVGAIITIATLVIWIYNHQK